MQIFPSFELKENHFESNIQLPVLSKEQTHIEKENKEEDNNITLVVGGKESFSSVMTYDSFNDDFLSSEKEQNNINLIEDKVKNNNTELILKEIGNKEINEIENDNNEVKAINTGVSSDTYSYNNNNISNNKNNNICCNRATKVKIIIIIIIILIIGVVLGIILSK